MAELGTSSDAELFCVHNNLTSGLRARAVGGRPDHEEQPCRDTTVSNQTRTNSLLKGVEL